MCAKLCSKKDMQSKFDSDSATVAVKISYQLFGMDLSFANLLYATFCRRYFEDRSAFASPCI